MNPGSGQIDLTFMKKRAGEFTQFASIAFLRVNDQHSGTRIDPVTCGNKHFLIPLFQTFDHLLRNDAACPHVWST